MWYRDDPRTHPQVNAAEATLLPVETVSAGHFKAPWRKLFTSRTVWCLCGQYFACSYSFWFFITWFPTYLLKARGFDLKQSALLAGTPLFVGAFGSLFAGWISPILSRRLGGAGPVRRGIGAAGAFGAAALLMLATWLTNPYMAVVAITLVAFCNDIQLPGAWTACMDVGGKAVATLSGTMNMMGNVGGFVSPIVCGYLVKQTGNWNLAFYVTAAAYVLGARLTDAFAQYGFCTAIRWAHCAGLGWTRSPRSSNRANVDVHFAASKPTTVQAMAMIAAMRDSPAISPEAIGT